MKVEEGIPREVVDRIVEYVRERRGKEVEEIWSFTAVTCSSKHTIYYVTFDNSYMELYIEGNHVEEVLTRYWDTDYDDYIAYLPLTEEWEKYPFLIEWVDEELSSYGNVFVLMMPHGGEYVKIRGDFLDNIVRLFPCMDDEFDDVRPELFAKYDDIVFDILRGVSWEPTDAWRGRYTSKYANDWVKVIEGWHSIGGSRFADRVNSILRCEKVFDFPILFLFLRCSNVLTTYFDIYCPRENREELKKYLLPEGEIFDLDVGVWAKAH